jgi:GAF domain/PilZ domain/Sel1 repeat
MHTFGNNLAAHSREAQSAYAERRQCVRQKVHIPAYANLSGKSSGMVLDLSEILDISEQGMCIQTATPLARNLSLPVVLDLAETKAYLMTMGTVVWSDSAGRAGISFSDLPGESRQQLKEWLFANAIAACVNHVDASQPTKIEPSSAPIATDEFEPPVRPDYTSILIALAAVKREVDLTGRDLEKALRLIANRARAFTRSTGAAIALAENSDSQEIICRGRAGPDAPPLGTSLSLGPGFSGECFRTGKLLRCEDAETDLLVDRESCRHLGIRSMIAVPVCNDQTVLGLLEVFSSQPRAFIANDDMVLQRLAEMIAGAIRNVTYVPPAKVPVIEAVPAKPQPSNSDSAKSGFIDLGLANADRANSYPTPVSPDIDRSPRFSTPWFGWVLLIASAVTLIVALLWLAAPWLKERMQGFTPSNSRQNSNDPAVKAPAPGGPSASDSQGMQHLAEQGDPVAQFEVGARYATGEDVPQDYSRALIWFSKAAEQGNVAAQATLGAYYWAGRGVPQDLSKAYYWAILAEAGGDEGSKYRVALLASRLNRGQILAEQKRAEEWISAHQSHTPTATRPAQ